MTIGREAKETVRVVDEYCEAYRDLFGDVRSYEYFKLLHVGLMSELPRKSLPAISRAVGEENSQGLHHFVAEGDWAVEALRDQRLALTRQALGGRGFTLCIDETGEVCDDVPFGKRAPQRTMWRDNTSAMWARSRTGWCRSMRTGCWSTPPFRFCLRSSNQKNG